VNPGLEFFKRLTPNCGDVHCTDPD